MHRVGITCSRGGLLWCSRGAEEAVARSRYNQGKVEEASAVIVACGDADGWRKDLDLMLQHGRREECRRAMQRRPRAACRIIFRASVANRCRLAEQDGDDRVYAYAADGRGDGI